MKLIITLCYLFFATSILFANQADVNELLRKISEEKQDTTKAKLYLDLSQLTNDLDSIFYYSELCLNLVEQSIPKANKEQLKALLISKATSINNLGYVEGQRGNLNKQMDYYLKAIALYHKTNYKVGLATTYSNLAYLYSNQGQIKKSLDYNTYALKIMEDIKDQHGIARSLNNIGSIYDNQNDKEKALDYYKQSLNIRIKIGDDRGIGICLTNIGSVFRDQGSRDSAISYYHKAKTKFNLVNDEILKASVFNNLGNIYLKSNSLDSAEYYFFESLALREKNNHKEGLSYSYSNLGTLFWKKKDYNASLKYAKESHRMALELGYPKNIFNSAFLLSDIYKATGNYKEAIEMQDLMMIMKDSMDNENTRKMAIKASLKSEFDKKALSDSLKTVQEKSLMQVKIDKEQSQKKFLYLIIFLSLISIAFIINRFKVSLRQKQIIEKQKAIVENKQKELLDSINYSKTLQHVFLPKNKLVKSYLEKSFILYLPKDIVAGDFYWMQVSDRNDNLVYNFEDDAIIYIAVCDSTGHGVPGAMVSVVCNNALNSAIKEFGKRIPGEILDKTRDLVIEHFGSADDEGVKDGMDASLIMIDLKQRIIKWSGANCPLWIVSKIKPVTLSQINEIDGVWEVKPDKFPIGKGYETLGYNTHQIQLQPGDTIYMSTDGYADQFGGDKGKKLTKTKFRSHLCSIANLPLEEQHNDLYNFHLSYKGNEEQVDDICVIGVQL